MNNFLRLIIATICLFNVFYGWSQSNIPPTMVASGDQVYCPLSQIKVTTSFTIIDPDDTEIEALYIQISSGYEEGEDLLILTGNHPNIVSSWNSIEGKLSLTGIGGVNVPYSEIIAAVNDVVFQSNSANVMGEKFFSFTIGNANFLPSTGHYYEYVPQVGISWTNAKAAAEARTYYGLQGYLVTITSAEEAQLSGEQAAGTGWIGGSDEESEGIWKWVTGPEAGRTFWFGQGNGTTTGTDEPFAFWNTSGFEPNNQGNEDYAHIVSPNLVNNGNAISGSWNDLPNTGGGGDYVPQGYIVEYGGMPGDPTLVNLSASTKITIPKIETTTNAQVCGPGSVTLQATSSIGNVVWYDAPTGGNPIHTGTTFTTPVLSATTSYYVLASYNGCLEGSRTEVVAIVRPVPAINQVTGALICNQGTAILTATASLGTIYWYDVPTGGTPIASGNSFTTPEVTNTTTYYVDATSNGCTTASRTPVTVTVQKTAQPTGNSLQTFCDMDSATVADLAATGTDVQWYASQTDTTPLLATEPLLTGTYYATQTENTCESPSRLSVDVIIYETVPFLSASVPPLIKCDNDTDGDYANGIVTFDLTERETLLLNGSTASNFDISYFLDASYNNQITNPSAFENTVAGGQTIYVRISNTADASCFTDAEFNVQVNPLPFIIESVVFKNCDEDGVPDGYTNFNLNEVIPVITPEDTSTVNITFHLSVSDAETGANAILPSPFNNQTSSIVYARVAYLDTGCYNVATINLEVSTTSFPSDYVNNDLKQCDIDNDNDGISVFNLSSVSSTFLSYFPSGQNLSVHYYHNLEDAQLEQNEITNVTTYKNEIPFSEVLYVRVESGDNGDCYGIGPHLLLTVHPRPEFEVDQDSIYCLNGGPITLSTFNPKGNYTYTWMDENGSEVSNSSTAEVNDGGIYTVIATSVYNCESFPVSFNVVQSGISNITENDVTVVGLSDNNSITIDTSDIGIGDYEFSLNNEFGPFQDSPFFDHIPSGDHTLYVRDRNGCGTEALSVFVLGFPRYFTPNGDGINDTWNIRGLGNDYTNNSTVRIYNRYGKLIKQLTPGISGWNGSFRGQDLAGSDYWFIAHLVDVSGQTTTYRGHFSLIR